jgi:hypothetical protein
MAVESRNPLGRQKLAGDFLFLGAAKEMTREKQVKGGT